MRCSGTRSCRRCGGRGSCCRWATVGSPRPRCWRTTRSGRPRCARCGPRSACWPVPATLDLARMPVLSVTVRPTSGGRAAAGRALVGAARRRAVARRLSGSGRRTRTTSPPCNSSTTDARPRGYAKIGWNDGDPRDGPDRGGGAARSCPGRRRATRHRAAADAAHPVATGAAGDGRHRADAAATCAGSTGRAAPRSRRCWRSRGAAAPGARRAPAGRLAVPRRTWGASRAAGAGPARVAVVDALAARDGGLTLEFGDWHGDWVPWNMARHRRRPAGLGLGEPRRRTYRSASTWRTRRSRPPCRRTASRRPSAPRAVDEALAAARRRRWAWTATAAGFVADAYLIELWLRTFELSARRRGLESEAAPRAARSVGYTAIGGSARTFPLIRSRTRHGCRR